jgi:zinc transport system substrate-binding protein
MKQILWLFLFALVISSCNSGQNKKNSQTKPVVIVSILPQKTFAEKIAGDDFDVQVLVPHGANPESYSLLPSQLKDISRADVWFRIGHIGFELSWQDRVSELNSNMQVIDLSDGLDLIQEEEIQHGDHVHVGGIDPHIWLSPKLVKQMSEEMTEVLSGINPEKASEYKGNYMQFVKEIDRLDVDLRKTLKDYKGRSFITFHPSLSYFARDYGLQQHALESGGKEPTPQHMARVVELARKENIGVIYIQSEFDRDNARVFAEEIKGKVIEVKPLSPEWEENLREMANMFIDNF